MAGDWANGKRIVETLCGGGLAWRLVPCEGGLVIAPATVRPGQGLSAIDAFGDRFKTRALSDVERVGYSFPVVWIEVLTTTGKVETAPWPVEALELYAEPTLPDTGDWSPINVPAKSSA